MLLSQVVPKLPSGVFKVLVDGGQYYSAVEVLQINGTSATTLQVAYDSALGSTSTAAKPRRASVRRSRVPASPKMMFHSLPQ